MTAARHIKTDVILETQECGACGILFAAPASFWRRKKETGEGWHCPNGHSRVFIQSENQKLREKLDEQVRAATEMAERAKRTEEALKKEKAAAKRTAKRVHAGVCPCCNRTFQNLARHMATKHKDEKP